MLLKKEHSTQITKLEKSIVAEQTAKRKEMEKLAKTKATEEAVKKFNEDSARLEATLAEEKEARRADAAKFEADAVAARAAAEKARAEAETALLAEKESRKTDVDAAREAKEAQAAVHRERVRELEAGWPASRRVAGGGASERSCGCSLDAANLDKAKLEGLFGGKAALKRRSRGRWRLRRRWKPRSAPSATRSRPRRGERREPPRQRRRAWRTLEEKRAADGAGGDDGGREDDSARRGAVSSRSVSRRRSPARRAAGGATASSPARRAPRTRSIAAEEAAKLAQALEELRWR